MVCVVLVQPVCTRVKVPPDDGYSVVVPLDDSLVVPPTVWLPVMLLPVVLLDRSVEVSVASSVYDCPLRSPDSCVVTVVVPPEPFALNEPVNELALRVSDDVPVLVTVCWS